MSYECELFIGQICGSPEVASEVLEKLEPATGIACDTDNRKVSYTLDDKTIEQEVDIWGFDDELYVAFQASDLVVSNFPSGTCEIIDLDKAAALLKAVREVWPEAQLLKGNWES